MAYKMKGFSGFKSSPAKQYKKPTGPRATVKKTTKKEMRKQADELEKRDFEWEKYNPSVEGFTKRELSKKKTPHDPLVAPHDKYGNIDSEQKWAIEEQEKR